MKYVEVAVNAPVAWPRTFTYSVPTDIFAPPGSAVWVPFGKRLLQGVVFSISDSTELEETREVSERIGDEPLLSENQLELARWISENYLAPLFDSASLMLPPGFERRYSTVIDLTEDLPAEKLSNLDPLEKKVMNFLKRNGRTDTRQLKKIIPQKQIQFIIKRLSAKKLITKISELQEERIKPKMVPQIHLAATRQKARQETLKIAKRAPRQAAILDLLIRKDGPITLAEARQKIEISPSAVKTLEQKGLIKLGQVREVRDPLAGRDFPKTPPPELTPHQQAAFDQISRSLQGKSSQRVFLLHGVTGSGKTEIYLRALEQALTRGKKGIVLVPEIALTPQTIARFAARFPNRVAVIHSRLSPGEQFDEWQRIRKGEFDVVIGSRSALFAPQPDLGLIVIDEEHEWTYKQSDKIPPYHARSVALKMVEILKPGLILGSATPDLESYHKAERGDFRLLELPERVGKRRDGVFPSLPEVEIIDLREELKSGNRSIFSRKLHKNISAALDMHEQVILFLNRRGTASFVQCRDCGHVMGCRRCEITLTYHASEEILTCHQCNLKRPVPTVCPECESPRIKFLGIGTQKVAEETAKAFPHARILRWDRDVTGGKNSHEEILQKFQSHEADILIGTQMIAKGLDIPLVTLVGVINADVGLFLPDFRAGERTFQLLMQVAGRAGRGRRPGQVIIQSYAPDHYAIQAAAAKDYNNFYRQEIALRHKYANPPFSRLASLIFSHTNNRYCRQESQIMADRLEAEIKSQGIADAMIIGPVPAFLQRLRGRYRWQLILKSPDPLQILQKLTFGQGWSVNIDPVGLT